MKKCIQYCWHRVKDDSGAQFVEYAMLAGLIGIGVAVGVAAFGQEIVNLFDAMSEAVRDIITDMTAD